MARAAELSVRGFGRMWRSGGESWGKRFGLPLFEAVGAVLVVASLLLLLALLTYNPGDVSLDTASDQAPRNFLGANGALVADLMIQIVGLAAYLVPAVLLGWAFRLMLQRPVRRPLRGLLLLLLALVLGAAALSILRPGLALPAGAGGAVGWLILAAAGRIGLQPIALPLAMAAAALVALLLLTIIGLSPGDWRDIGTGAGRGATRVARTSGAVLTALRRLLRRSLAAREARRETHDVWPLRPSPRTAAAPPAERREPLLARTAAAPAPPPPQAGGGRRRAGRRGRGRASRRA